MAATATKKKEKDVTISDKLEMLLKLQQIDTEIPQTFPDLKVYAVKEHNRFILSDLSEEATQFGTDIQFDRESFENTYFQDNDKLLVCIIAIIVIVCFVLYYNKNKLNIY